MNFSNKNGKIAKEQERCGNFDELIKDYDKL